jgi:hypothetical protein
MIKKSIASVLVLLILINSVGCYSYSQIKKEDAEKLWIWPDDRVKISTIDEKIYILTDVTIKGSEVKGLVVRNHSEWLRDIQGKEIVISFKEIKKIEVETFETGSTKVVIVVSVLVLVGIIWLIVEMKEAMEN